MDRARITKMVFKTAQLHGHLDDANPDVGMGPGVSELIDRAVKTLEIEEGEFDRTWAVDLFLANRRRW